MFGGNQSSHSGCRHAQPLFLLSFAVLFCSSDAAFPYLKPFPSASSNGLKYSGSFELQHQTRSGHDRRNHSWLLAASSQKQTSKRSRSDTLATTMAIPNGGAIVERYTASELNTILRMHLYIATMYECIRNPTFTPVVNVAAICQIRSGAYWDALILGIIMPVFLGTTYVDSRRSVRLLDFIGPTEGLALSAAVFLMLVLSMIEAAILWANYKSLDIKNLALLVALMISFWVYKNQ